MKKSNLTGLLIGLIVFGMVSSASAAPTPTTLISQGDTWNYTVLKDVDLWSVSSKPEPTWSSYANFNTINDSSLVWSSGQAAFGSTYKPGGLNHTIKTNWEAGTDLALKKTIDASGITGKATLNVAADNGFIIYLNGKELERANAELYTTIDPWEYIYTIDLLDGNNTFAILAEDHGGATYFDMQLTANVNPVPVPAAVWLLGSGLAGLVTVRRKIAKK